MSEICDKLEQLLREKGLTIYEVANFLNIQIDESLKEETNYKLVRLLDGPNENEMTAGGLKLLNAMFSGSGKQMKPVIRKNISLSSRLRQTPAREQVFGDSLSIISTADAIVTAIPEYLFVNDRFLYLHFLHREKIILDDTLGMLDRCNLTQNQHRHGWLSSDTVDD